MHEPTFSRTSSPSAALAQSALALIALSATAWSQAPPSSQAESLRVDDEQSHASDARRIPLRVLYAGSPEGARTADFLAFLRDEFSVVGQTSYPDFRPEEADAYDVVILDVEMHPTERSIGIGKQPTLPQDWSRATVLVNGPGVIIADRQLAAKLDWL
jgi:hypothetical protein